MKKLEKQRQTRQGRGEAREATPAGSITPELLRPGAFRLCTGQWREADWRERLKQ